MKRWMVLLIVFACMGGWIVLSGCNAGSITSDDVAACMVCAGECTIDCSDSCVKSCFETCFDCSWCNSIECNGDPIQYCFDCSCAFTNACSEKHNEEFEGPSGCNNTNG